MKMRKLLSVAGMAVLFCMLAVSVQAKEKTLVFCSEGSPEGFTPALYTSGTTFDASSRQVFDKLSMFERGATKIVPGLATSWDVSADGIVYTFHLRKEIGRASCWVRVYI